MNQLRKLVRVALTTVIIFTVGCAWIVNANAGTFDAAIDQVFNKKNLEKSEGPNTKIEFLVNPNKLPPCPKPDLSKKTDMGVGGRTGKWNNCWGKYKIELEPENEGELIEGEWKNGVLSGSGMTSYPDGDKFFCLFKDGYPNGLGLWISADGSKTQVNYKKGKKYGQVISTYPSGAKRISEYIDGKKSGKEIYYTGDELTTITTHYENGQQIGDPEISTSHSEKKIDVAAAAEIEFKINPNKLPFCPKPDLSKKIDVGAGGRTEKWNNCWGQYEAIESVLNNSVFMERLPLLVQALDIFRRSAS